MFSQRLDVLRCLREGASGEQILNDHAQKRQSELDALKRKVNQLFFANTQNLIVSIQNLIIRWKNSDPTPLLLRRIEHLSEYCSNLTNDQEELKGILKKIQQHLKMLTMKSKAMSAFLTSLQEALKHGKLYDTQYENGCRELGKRLSHAIRQHN